VIRPEKPSIAFIAGHCQRTPGPSRWSIGALAKLDGDLLFFAIGVPRDPELAGPIREHLAKLAELLAPHASGLDRYLNFCEHRVSIGDAFDTETLTRLREVRDRVNPDELIRSNHPLGRA
jgi:hypothetical protein